MKKAFLATFLLLTSASFSFAADIVDTAVAAGSFKTLVSLLKAAGLVDTLKSAGPFTVFAPNDAAFAKVPKATMDMLAANPDKLKAVLTYHVIAAKVMAADVKTGEAKTVNGQMVALKVAAGKVTVNRAHVIKADIVCDNGVIHVIDAVILPKM